MIFDIFHNDAIKMKYMKAVSKPWDETKKGRRVSGSLFIDRV